MTQIEPQSLTQNGDELADAQRSACMPWPRGALPILVAAAMAPLLLFARPDFVEPLAAMLFVAAIWVALVPAYLTIARRDRVQLPFLALTCLVYIVFFALPPFFIERGWWTLGNPTNGMEFGVVFERITAFTAGLALGAVVMLVSGYYLTRRYLPSSLPVLMLPPAPATRQTSALLWGLALAYLLYLNTPELRASSTLAQAVAPLGYFALGALFVRVLRGAASRWEAAIYWALLLPLLIMSQLREGLITPAILCVAFLLGLFWYVRRRLLPILVVAICCVFLAFPVMKSPAAIIGALEPVKSVVLRALGKEQSSSAEVNARPATEILTPILRRISLVVLLQYCVDMTPERIPFLKGETLRNLLTNPVPRVFWPGKPPETLGQWFGHKYLILAPDDLGTSINVPWLVEFYVNFGLVGVLLGMAAVGALLAALEAVLLAPGMSDLAIVAGWSLIFRLFYQESNVSLMLGGLPAQILFLLAFLHVALRLVARAERRTAPTGEQVAA